MMNYFRKPMVAAVMRLDDVVRDIYNGHEFGISLMDPKGLEDLKDRSYPIMGPLWVTVDIYRELYLVKRDLSADDHPEPGRWG